MVWWRSRDSRRIWLADIVNLGSTYSHQSSGLLGFAVCTERFTTVFPWIRLMIPGQHLAHTPLWCLVFHALSKGSPDSDLGQSVEVNPCPFSSLVERVLYLCLLHAEFFQSKKAYIIASGIFLKCLIVKLFSQHNADIHIIKFCL